MTIKQLMEALTEARRRGLPPETRVLLGYEGTGDWASDSCSTTKTKLKDTGEPVLVISYENSQEELED